jgi:CheY-like chemotaxis protein
MRTVHPNATLPTILVADDHAIFAETLSNYLEGNADLVLFASKRHLISVNPKPYERTVAS